MTTFHSSPPAPFHRVSAGPARRAWPLHPGVAVAGPGLDWGFQSSLHYDEVSRLGLLCHSCPGVCANLGMGWWAGPATTGQVRTALHGDKSQTGVLPRPTGTDRRARDQGPRLSSARHWRPQTAPLASHTGQVGVGSSPGECSCVPREPCDSHSPVTHCVQVSPCRAWARGPAVSCASGAPLLPTQASGVSTICKSSR